ncbi:hypothetical protein Tco_0570414 [Tanacetum coccineum]
MLEPYLCATNAYFTILDRALQSAEITRGLVIKPRIVGNRGNQTENGEAWGMVYAFGGGEADQDPKNIADNADA